jgi:hypothetical protein
MRRPSFWLTIRRRLQFASGVCVLELRVRRVVACPSVPRLPRFMVNRDHTLAHPAPSFRSVKQDSLRFKLANFSFSQILDQLGREIVRIQEHRISIKSFRACQYWNADLTTSPFHQAHEYTPCPTLTSSWTGSSVTAVTRTRKDPTQFIVPSRNRCESCCALSTGRTRRAELASRVDRDGLCHPVCFPQRRQPALVALEQTGPNPGAAKQMQLPGRLAHGPARRRAAVLRRAGLRRRRWTAQKWPELAHGPARVLRGVSVASRSGRP